MRRLIAPVLLAVALLTGCTKTVLVGISADSSGNIKDIGIARSSGFRNLDYEAIQHARKGFPARFRALDQKNKTGSYVIPVKFVDDRLM